MTAGLTKALAIGWWPPRRRRTPTSLAAPGAHVHAPGEWGRRGISFEGAEGAEVVAVCGDAR